ncbi:MAG: LytTR family DNA-binding domain-containing protein [Ruthenibacterium sp.]
MRIAICENDADDLALLQQMTQDCLQHLRSEATLCTYTDARQLACDIRDGMYFDAFLLDILMPEISGIELGEQIRKKNATAPIVYTTTSQDFAMEAFGVHALRYLVKPVRETELMEAIDSIQLHLASLGERPYCIRTRDGLVSVDLQRIVCVENSARTLVITLEDGTLVRSVSNRVAFEQKIAPLLEDAAFIQPHKSYAVNMRYIYTLTGDSITLDDGGIVPVSRHNATMTKKRYLQYLSANTATC